MRKYFLILAALLMLNTCGQPGDLPMPSVKNNTVKGITWFDYGTEMFRAIEMICYIDTARYNPLNALDYTLENSGLQFFDYLILGGVYLKKDSKGFYLDFSKDLMSVLTRKNRLIVPLQKAGIKVLLGVQSQGNASLGNVNEDEMGQLANDIYTALQMYSLDGVEFYDDAAPDAYPPNLSPHLGEFDPDVYPEDIDPAEWDYKRWLLRGWEEGGKSFNDFFYTIRYKYDAAVRKDVPIIVREKNYGSYLSDRAYCTSGFADFAGSVDQITYHVNVNSSIFKEKSDVRYQDEYVWGGDSSDDPSGDSWIDEEQYAPFFLELDGGPARNIFYPQFDTGNFSGSYGDEVSAYIGKFRGPREDELEKYPGLKRRLYQAIYCNNLKPLSETADDPFYKNLHFKPDPDKPENDFLSEEDEDWSNARAIPAVYIFSMIARTMFGEAVVCSGGDHLKDW
jgi:hypothetical protein